MILHETTDRLLRRTACAILLAASVTAGAQQTAPVPNVTSPATPPATTTAQPSSSAGPASSPARNQTLPTGEVPGSTPAPILGAPPASPTAPGTSAAEPKQATVPGASSATSPGTTPAVSGGQVPASTPAASASSGSAAAQAATAATSSSVLAFSDALSRASVSSTEYNTAVTESGVAIADRAIARAAVLPTVIYHNQFLYTQGVGVVVTTPATAVTSIPRFIANNAVHEYISQGVANETISVAGIANFRRANAAIAVANAKLEIARRNLVVAVATSYYTLLSTDKKLTVAQHAQDEADSFVNLTQKLEAAGEVAHADVIKAQLQQQQRHRDRIDAQLANEKARLDLGVFLFPDPRTAYTLAESQNVTLPTLPPYPEVQAAAQGNPDLRAAIAALRAAQLDVTSARAAYLPDLALNYSYGIDAAQFAIHSRDGTRNLGYSASATLDIPIFDWFATPARVKQATLRTRLAQLELTAAQRRAIAQLEEFYHEAEGALTELASLDQSVATAAESLRLVYLRYRAGEATVLEVVDAQNSASAAESARADGIVRYRVALANLQTLTGSLPQ